MLQNECSPLNISNFESWPQLFSSQHVNKWCDICRRSKLSPTWTATFAQHRLRPMRKLIYMQRQTTIAKMSISITSKALAQDPSATRTPIETMRRRCGRWSSKCTGHARASRSAATNAHGGDTLHEVSCLCAQESTGCSTCENPFLSYRSWPATSCAATTSRWPRAAS